MIVYRRNSKRALNKTLRVIFETKMPEMNLAKGENFCLHVWLIEPVLHLPATFALKRMMTLYNFRAAGDQAMLHKIYNAEPVAPIIEISHRDTGWRQAGAWKAQADMEKTDGKHLLWEETHNSWPLRKEYLEMSCDIYNACS